MSVAAMLVSAISQRHSKARWITLREGRRAAYNKEQRKGFNLASLACNEVSGSLARPLQRKTSVWVGDECLV
jgi:hypothetical protein